MRAHAIIKSGLIMLHRKRINLRSNQDRYFHV